MVLRHNQFVDSDWLKSQFRINPDKTKAGLAKALGLDAPAISKILAGSRQIKAHEYVGMRAYFGLPVERDKITATGRQTYTLTPLNEADLHDQDQAGEADAWIMPASLFEKRTKAPPEQIRIVTVQGDSMAPDFPGGDHVLVDLSDRNPSPAGVFLVSDGVGQMIRQCEHIPHAVPPTLRISARNEKYAPYEIAHDKAAILGRVIAKLEWL